MDKFDQATAYFSKQSRPWLFVQGLALVGIVGFVDYITGYELAFYPFYSIPILFMVWFDGRNAAVVISAISSFVWWWADAAAGHVYHSGWLLAWDILVRFSFYMVVTFGGSAFRQKRDAIAARVRLLEHSQRLEHEIISVSERERQRIGRDLHDGICQYLAANGLTADLLRQNLAKEDHPRTEAAGEIALLLQEAVDRAREIARGLSPVDRDEGGLESALEELTSSTERLTGISCDFLCTELLPFYDNIRAIHLFRIAQEAIGNATRHGHARNIIVALEGSNDDYSLRISDDGSGFDPANVAGGRLGGMGLNIMRYRARTLGGALEIYPNLPQGTVIACTVRSSASRAAPEPAFELGELAYGNRP